MTVRRAVRLETGRPGGLVRAWDGGEWSCLLESRGEGGRYDYLCAQPLWVLRSRRGVLEMGAPGSERSGGGCAFEAIRRILREYGRGLEGAELHDGSLPPFQGGLVGYFGYELLYALEQIPDTGRDDRPMPDCALGMYPWVISHDRANGQTWLVANGFGHTRAEAGAEAVRRIVEVREHLQNTKVWGPQEDREGVPRDEGSVGGPEVWEALDLVPVCSKEDYLGIVAEVKAHIEAGDVFEVCTSQRFDGRFEGDAQTLYQAVAEAAQAPFSAFLRTPDGEVICASPERFLRMTQEGVIESRPMKGTRPRSASPQEDEALRADLETNPKDAAELLMITDLVRNDLGRVCAFGTVKVPDEGSVQGFAFTWQRSSVVTGRLRPGLDGVDLLRAAFPGGSMTGAPKIEAMRLIDRLEPVKRGVFGGSVGFMDLGGALDLNIVIRTLIKQGDAVHFHVGGAVVSDSDPEAEYQETIDKAVGLVHALHRVRVGSAGDLIAPEGPSPEPDEAAAE